MLDFAKFVEEASPKIERVALELADRNGALKYPIQYYFIVTTETFYANGIKRNSSVDSVPFQELEEKFNKAEADGFTVEFNEEEQSFTLTKVFNDGKRREISYVPYDKTVFDIKISP